MQRNDHLAGVPEDQMNVEQLTFRRNGYAHDAQEAILRGDQQAVINLQKAHDAAEAALRNRIGEAQ